MDANDRAPRGTLVRGLRSTVGRESTTFGFSILMTVSFGMLQHLHGAPDAGRIYLFAAGAVLSFTLLEATLSGGFRRPMPQHHTRVLSLGTSLNLISVLGALGSTWLCGQVPAGAAVWALAPFVSAVVYLLLEGTETALGERLARSTGDEEAEQLEP